MASWFFIHYRKSVTSNTFQFRDDSESKSVINKTFCGHRLHWFKKIKSNLLFSNAEWNYNREREKSKYLDNISVLPTSIFIFDKFVDGAQPEVAPVASTFWEPCSPHFIFDLDYIILYWSESKNIIVCYISIWRKCFVYLLLNLYDIEVLLIRNSIQVIW